MEIENEVEEGERIEGVGKSEGYFTYLIDLVLIRSGEMYETVASGKVIKMCCQVRTVIFDRTHGFLGCIYLI